MAGEKKMLTQKQTVEDFIGLVIDSWDSFEEAYILGKGSPTLYMEAPVFNRLFAYLYYKAEESNNSEGLLELVMSIKDWPSFMRPNVSTGFVRKCSTCSQRTNFCFEQEIHSKFGTGLVLMDNNTKEIKEYLCGRGLITMGPERVEELRQIVERVIAFVSSRKRNDLTVKQIYEYNKQREYCISCGHETKQVDVMLFKVNYCRSCCG